jgi:Ca2+-binding EF-hand superfamily protein
LQIEVETCGKALRWLGWNSSYELFMQITGDVDLDLSGCIDLMEFNKLVRMYNEREMKELQRQLVVLGLPGGDFKADVSAELVEKLLVRLDFSEGERMEVLQGLLLHDASQVCDVFQLVSAVRELRHAARRTCRDNEGFSPGEVAKLEEAFSLCQEPGSNPRTGHVVGFGLTKLLTEHFTPKAGIKSVAWKQVLAMLPGYKTSRGRDMLTFFHFLQLKRMWRDREHQIKSVKEQAAIAKVGFTPGDVREFRAIFVENDVWYQDQLEYDVVKTVLHRVCILGDRLKQEFHSAWLAVMTKDDGLCPDIMDFPEFLLLMRQLIDTDFAGIGNGESK